MIQGESAVKADESGRTVVAVPGEHLIHTVDPAQVHSQPGRDLVDVGVAARPVGDQVQ